MNIRPPALFVCGRVVSLRPELSWFEKRPLWGRRIAVTRTRSQAGKLSAALRELGAQVEERPSSRYAPSTPARSWKGP
ncbi:MAG: hypothetical protein LBT40_11620 [Deltaproteobacteria bacterium]|nr:hypothetical protein [Deltaproteobacteria bacterium]